MQDVPDAPSDRRSRIDAICAAALELDGEARAAYVGSACGNDAELLADVESLLAHADQAKGFLSEPLAAVAAAVLRDTTPSAGHGPGPLTGTRLDTFEVGLLLGQGGMGHVYRARDTVLGRDVALKVLPPEIASDPERLARFEREAQAMAAFSHPHIAQIHAVVAERGVRALVMEFVRGVTLADLGPVSLNRATALLRQVVDALQAAHERGLVHRDLKPANIMVTDTGEVKLIDFGIAKSVGAADATMTLDDARTLTGQVVGTAAYMSPELATGRAVDRRSDIWALGCVMYELLSGTRAFQGESSAEALAAVLRAEPDYSRLPSSVPPALTRVLARCLEKDRQNRLADVSIVRYVLDEITTTPTPPPPAGADRRGGWWQRPVVAWSIATACLLAVVALSTAGARQGRVPARAAAPVRSSIATPPDVDVLYGSRLAISPDGSRIAFVGIEPNGGRQLYIRHVSDDHSTPVDGTRGASAPCFSPDGRWVAFSASGRLQKAPIGGGQPVSLADGIGGYFDWGDDGTIVFARAGRIFRMAADGGTPQPVTSASTDVRFPQALPANRGVLFTIGTGPGDDAKVAVFDARSGQVKDLIRGSASARYVKSGHVVYARGGTLFGQPFDIDRLELTGPATPVASGVEEDTDGTPAYALSDDGVLVYVPGTSGGPKDVLTLVDMAGRAEPTAFPPGPVVDPRFSPDGERIAVTLQAARNNTWVYDIVRKTSTRVTDGRYHFPVWTPDGRLTLARGPLMSTAIVTRQADAEGADDVVVEDGDLPDDWSRDGRTLYFERRWRPDVAALGAMDTDWDIWMWRPGTKPVPVVATTDQERQARVSPDGRWMAYFSRQTVAGTSSSGP